MKYSTFGPDLLSIEEIEALATHRHATHKLTPRQEKIKNRETAAHVKEVEKRLGVALYDDAMMTWTAVGARLSSDCWDALSQLCTALSRAKRPIEAWKENPRAAFKAFVRSADFTITGRSGKRARITTTTANSYCNMFDKMLRAAARADVPFLLMTPQQIASAISELRAVGKLRVAYLRLLYRIFLHLAETADIENPIPRVAKLLLLNGTPYLLTRKPPLLVVNRNERSKVLAQLKKMNSEPQLRAKRDAAACAVLMGTGATSAELLALRRGDIRMTKSTGTCTIKLSLRGITRMLPLERDLTQILNSWITESTRHRPKNWDGRIFDSFKGKDRIGRGSLFSITKSVFESAGIRAGSLGPMRFRTIYLHHELANGSSDEYISTALAITRRDAYRVYLASHQIADSVSL